MDDFHDTLRMLADDGLTRRLRALPAVGGRFDVRGHDVLNFSSNDYLDFARSAALKDAAHAAIDTIGCGSTASRLMAGHTDLHEHLESRLAAWLKAEAALVFASGFQTNLGVLTALPGENDLIFSDRLNHASIIDGCRLSKATIVCFAHGDADDLDFRIRQNACRGRRFIVTESVFSMDGDLAPVRALRAIADRHDAILIVDEAHALGVFGPQGAGVCAAEYVAPDVLIGTLGKSLGSFGGFAAARRTIVDLLINRARSFIYSTGLPPASTAAAAAAVDELERSPNLGESLRRKASRFASALRAMGLDVTESPTHILPIILGENDAVMHVAQRLFDQDILVTGIRPPTVPPGTARLRLSVTLAHTDQDLDRAATALASVVRDVAAGAPS